MVVINNFNPKSFVLGFQKMLEKGQTAPFHPTLVLQFDPNQRLRPKAITNGAVVGLARFDKRNDPESFVMIVLESRKHSSMLQCNQTAVGSSPSGLSTRLSKEINVHRFEQVLKTLAGERRA
ncbi:hypothetical protein HPP92_021110 [Vanilla planifolia]|uniref:Uncharacterized protein n=1 Tax=Vanilla planifolia TaxID=51239 RepID=A0A835PZ86_VANPL|nr:hypothetical protein HPP92_021110 [Vanilla planifolia]